MNKLKFCGLVSAARCLGALPLILAIGAASSAALADEEPYEYIKTPGYDPAIYSTNTCSAMTSEASPLVSGTLALMDVFESALEARFRTSLEGGGTRLDSTKIKRFIIIFR